MLKAVHPHANLDARGMVRVRQSTSYAAVAFAAGLGSGSAPAWSQN
jgi:hypothetical protein